MDPKLRFTPLDIPNFEGKEKVLREYTPDIDDFYWWSEEYISNRDRNEVWNQPVKMHDKHPELVEFVDKHFPFTGYILFKLIRPVREVDPHVDDSYLDWKGPNNDCNLISENFRNHQLETEPCGYRMIIEGGRSSLYLTDDNLENHQTCHVPETTDSFVMKSYGSYHGVKLAPEDKDRLLLFVIGWLDKEKHNDLIHRSKEKYGQFAVYS